jgi:hypothetical protein
MQYCSIHGITEAAGLTWAGKRPPELEAQAARRYQQPVDK